MEKKSSLIESYETVLRASIDERNRIISTALEIAKVLEKKELSVKEGMIALDEAKAIIEKSSLCSAKNI